MLKIRRDCGRAPSPLLGVNMGSELGLDDSRRGTRGQLVGGRVEGQVADHFLAADVRQKHKGAVSKSVARACLTP